MREASSKALRCVLLQNLSHQNRSPVKNWPQNSVWEMASSIENADKEMGTSSLDGTGSPWKSAAQNVREYLRGYSGEVRQQPFIDVLQKTDTVHYHKILQQKGNLPATQKCRSRNS